MTRAPTPWRRVHRAAVWLHRWTGLVIALFLILCGATGSVLAFGDELDALINPAFHRVTPAARRGPMLDPLVVRERLLAAYPHTTIDWVNLDTQPDAPMVFGLATERGSTAVLPNDELFVDPYDGHVLGARRNGDISQGMTNFIPFVDRLHTSLALGTVGSYVLGIAALLWTLDCFVGFYLTLPAPHDRRRPKTGVRRAWLHRWSYAWKLRWGAGATKLNFDWHRASGLWLWALIFVFAWSSVGFNLRAVYEPAMSATLGYRIADSDPPALVDPLTDPPIGFEAARVRARALMADAARREGFTVRRERLMHYDAEHAMYGYRTLSTLDVGDRTGNTNLYFDARDGHLLRVDLPTGRHAGNTIDAWIGALHTATVWGLTMQIVVSLMGIAVVALSVTGIVIWWQRRRARSASRAGRRRHDSKTTSVEVMS